MRENEKLVQYSELKPTENVDMPDKIPVEIIQSWWDVAKNICDTNGYTALAFNQIQTATLSKIGFGDKKPSLIYVGEIPSLEGTISEQLLINPEIQAVGELGDDISIEACGSIVDGDNVNPEMFIIRPAAIIGGAYFWKPGDKKAEFKEFSTALASASVIQHEKNHLNGKTALSDPSSVLDFTDKHILKEIQKYLGVYRYDILGILLKFKHWLVYDSSSKEFKVVGPTGNLVRKEFN